MIQGRVRAAWVRRCPHFIFDMGHYRAVGDCRCDDPSHPMDEWGYTWDGRRWK